MTVTSAVANLDVSPKPEKGPKHIPTLDGIRAVSFGIVFLAHAAASTGIGKWIPGYFGLATFFFLSGYLITTLLRIEFDRTEKIAFRDFYLRRVLRIFPPFYLILGLDCVLTLTHVLDNTLWPSAVLAQAFHLTNYWIVFHSHAPDAGWWYGLAPGSWIFWPLAVEEHFYLVFPLIYLLMRRRKMTPKQQMQALLGLCAAVLVWRCLLVFGFHVTKERTYVSSDTRVDSILFGCLLAVYGNPFLDMPTCSAERIKNFWVPLASVVLIASFGLGRIWHDFDQTLRYTVQGAALIPIFIAAVRYPGWGIFRWLNVPWVRFVGLLSYSLYLLHTTVLYAIGHHTHWHAPAVGLASLAVSLGLATLIYHFVEKPCARLRKKLSHVRRPSSSGLNISGPPPSAEAASMPENDGSKAPGDRAVENGAETGSSSQKVARNVMMTLGTQLISWSLTFAVTLYLPRYVGAEGLGKLAFAASFVTLFGAFVSLGTSTVLVKEIARDHRRAGELLPAAVLLRLPLSILATGLAIAAVSWLGYPSLMRVLITAYALGMVVLGVNDALSSALQGMENFSRQSLAVLVEKFLSSSLTIFLVLIHAPLWEIAAVGLFTGSVSLAVNLSAFKHLWGTMRMPTTATLRSLVLAGMPFLGYGLFNTLYGQTDPIVLKLVTNDATVGWFAAAFRLVGTTLFLPAAVMSALLPTFSRLHRQDAGEFRQLAQRTLTLVMLCAIPVSLILILLPREIVLLLHYPKSFEKSIPALQVGGVGVLLWYAASVLANLVTARDDQAKILRVSMYASLIGIPLCVACSYASDRVWHNGAMGALASDALLELYLVICYFRMLPPDLFQRQNGLVLVRAAVASLPMIYFLHGLPVSRFKIGTALLALAAYGAACWFLRCFSGRDLAILGDVFARKTGMGKVVRPRHILMLTPYYSPGVGGAPRLMQSIVEHLNGSGYSVEVLSYSGPINNDCPPFDRVQSYRIFRIAADYQSAHSIVHMGFRMLGLMLTRRYDVIFCGVAYPSAILAYFASLLLQVPYMVYSHGEDASPIKNTRGKRFFLAHALQSASALLVNSRFTQGEIAAFGIEAERIAIVPPGIDPAPYGQVALQDVVALRRRLGLEGKRIVLTVARLTERKGHDMIVRSLSQVRDIVPEVHYLIVGKGDTSVLQALAKAEGVEDSVTIVSYIEEGELNALYHLCDVYAMVSRHDPITQEVEGFGIVYLEAGACGKPCLAGAEGGAGDAVVDGVTGFVVDPTDVGKIASALTHLLMDPPRMASMGEAAHRRVWSDFRSDLLLEKLERLVAAVTWKR